MDPDTYSLFLLSVPSRLLVQYALRNVPTVVIKTFLRFFLKLFALRYVLRMVFPVFLMMVCWTLAIDVLALVLLELLVLRKVLPVVLPTAALLLFCLELLVLRPARRIGSPSAAALRYWYSRATPRAVPAQNRHVGPQVIRFLRSRARSSRTRTSRQRATRSSSRPRMPPPPSTA